MSCAASISDAASPRASVKFSAISLARARGTPFCAIDQALTDPDVLGAALGDPSTWTVWITVLKAAFGYKLNRAERRAFQKVAGGRRSPAARVRELWAVVGRRSGKSRMAAALAVYAALFAEHRLSPGETGAVLVVAASKEQAGIILDYVRGFLEASPILSAEVESITADEVRLHNGIVIGIHTANFRSVRGRTLIACIFDEVGFWRADDSALPDLETYRAILPALATSNGMLIGISSPYRKLGLLHQRHRDYFGTDDAEILVVAGASRDFNPTLDQRIIARALEDDPEAARSEWKGEFRNDLSAFLDDAVIDAAVDHGRPLELPPRKGVRYRVFTDPSGGRRDAFTLCIGHREGDRFVADVVRAKRPPFDPKVVVQEFAGLARQYGCNTITGDNYSAEWAASAFREARIIYRVADHPKSTLYLESLPSWMRGAISIPNIPPLLRELRLLERRTTRMGRDSVGHASAGSDDIVNSVCGCAMLALYQPAVPVARIGFYSRSPSNPPVTLSLGTNGSVCRDA